MKSIDIITIFPDMLKPLFSFGVISQGQKNKILKIQYFNPRDYSEDKHRNIDDRPYGGGEGMVMMPEPLKKVYESIPRGENSRFVYLSPQGQRLDSEKSFELSKYDHLIFLCGRYEGVDERFLSLYCDEEISVGDFVLSGGEIPCALAVDSISRFYPGILGNEASYENDTFQDKRLKHPQFTRPETFEGLPIPLVLKSGDHEKIREFREGISLLRTYHRRPDLFSICKERDSHFDKRWGKAIALFMGLSQEEKKVLGLLDISLENSKS